MKKIARIFLFGGLAACPLIFLGFPSFSEEVDVWTNLGLSGGQIYEIADTPKGNDMAENYISAKVKVTGTIEEKNDMKTITVTNFQVVPE